MNSSFLNFFFQLQAWIIDEHDVHKLQKTLVVPPNLMGINSEHSAIMVDLEKFTKYEISVLCFTNPGNGPRSIYQSVKTLEDVPNEVGSLNFEDILDRSVHVIWTPPENVNGILTGKFLQAKLHFSFLNLKVLRQPWTRD